MAYWFVSRYESTHAWLRYLMQTGQIAERVESDRMVTLLDPNRVRAGDVVMGTLPMSLILQVQKRGASFRALVMDAIPGQTDSVGQAAAEQAPPPQLEPGAHPHYYTAEELAANGARFVDVRIEEGVAHSIAPQADRAFDAPDLETSAAQVHVAFVSDQLTPLFLPARQFAHAIRHVELLATPRMKKQAERLKKLLSCPTDGSPSLPVALRDVGKCETYPKQLRAARDALTELRVRYPDARLIANLTGGTKPMALALAEALKQLIATGARVQGLYTNTDTNQYELLSPPGKSLRMTSRLTMATALGLQGYVVKECRSAEEAWRKRSEARQDVTASLWQIAERANYRIGELNWYARSACDMYVEESRRKEGLPSESPSTVKLNRGRNGYLGLTDPKLAFLTEARMVEVSKASELVTFANLDVARFLTGGWLEEWVWTQLKDCGFDAIACGVHVQQAETDTLNELDVLAVHNNRILVIECKTESAAENGRGKLAEAVYKLEAVSDHVARLQGTRLLVAARFLSDEVLSRAAGSGTSVLALADHHGRGGRFDGGERRLDCLPPWCLREMAERWRDGGRFLSSNGRASPFAREKPVKGEASPPAMRVGLGSFFPEALREETSHTE